MTPLERWLAIFGVALLGIDVGVVAAFVFRNLRRKVQREERAVRERFSLGERDAIRQTALRQIKTHKDAK